MAALTKNAFVAGVVTSTLVAAASGGDTVAGYTGKEFLSVNNGHATLPRTITIDSVEQCSQLVDHDAVHIIPALTRKFIKLPAPASRWTQTGGAINITYSDSAADITIGVFVWPE